MNNQLHKRKIVEYWRAVEFLIPQSIPKVDKRTAGQTRVFDVYQAEDLPWQQDKTRKKASNFTEKKQYQVYCGVYQIKTVRDKLIDLFGDNPKSYDKREDGDSCLFVFSLNGDGQVIPDSFTVSSCIWAVSRTCVSPGPNAADWLDGFDDYAKRAKDNFTERLLSRQASDVDIDIEQDIVPVTYNLIINEIRNIAEDLELTEIFSEFKIRVRQVQTSAKKQAAEKTEFINSFYLNDLKKVVDEIERGNYGKGLNRYLSIDPKTEKIERTDVRQSPQTLFDRLSPEAFPSGRWAGNGHHPLVLSQQFAVNSIFQDLSYEGGIFAVNGPPGTGKTTLLRDLIAGVIVERAKKLAALTHPKDAFAGTSQLQTEQRTRTISLWKEDFKGFEIVIASNNNGAVENVTMEIPGSQAIDPDWRGATDYFPDVASRLLNNAGKEVESPDDTTSKNSKNLLSNSAWALIAARLGSKANKSRFISNFWYREDNPLVDDGQSDLGLLDILKQMSAESVDWKDAVNKFNDALVAEQTLRRERSDFHRILIRDLKLQREINLLTQKRQELVRGLEPLRQEYEVESKNTKDFAGEVKEAKDRRLEHKSFEPSLVHIIFTLGRALREWRKQDANLVNEIKIVDHSLLNSKTRAAATEDKIKRAERNIKAIEYDINIAKMKSATEKLALQTIKNKLGDHFLSIEEWTKENDRRELSAPWSDRKWRDARARVFLEALNLHKAFIAGNSRTMMNNLWGAIDLLSGEMPISASSDTVSTLWTTLFFVVPVISTTFASFDKLFAHLGRETLGWLFIDEAGQATPQSAVGAIWRAKRTVVVGDPLQLEPIVGLPFTIQHAVAKHHKVEETWFPSNTSVQQLADRVSKYGTKIKNSEKSLWIGSPLRVHRRCAPEIFEISNRIAYDNLMILADRDPEFPKEFMPSRWIHVEPDNRLPIEHWIPVEGDALSNLLEELRSQQVNMSDIFLISPFRSVIYQLNQIAKNYHGLKVGTVHSTQGKEALIVILVLGSDPAKNGERNWASEKPNLLNVAVSRAQERLYVIGNYNVWRRNQYFQILAEKFPV